MRFATNARLNDKPKSPMPPEIQLALDAYATYFLGMCQLDLKDDKRAEFFFEKTLVLLPEPGRGQLYFNMFRWGAQANLARLKAAKGDPNVAATYESLPDNTMQRHGNLLRGRDDVWLNPLAPVPPLPPAAPPPLVIPGAPAV
jgi:hypothetical protein